MEEIIKKENRTFAGDLATEMQEISNLNSITDENVYSFTANFTEILTIICC